MADDEFKKQTPEVYKWAMGAGGFVAAATTASLAFKPETAGYSLSGLILFALLIFIVISLEVGTSKLDESNPLAKNAQLQVKVLSWFATVALNEKVNNCQDEYCWGDVTHATMRR